METQVRRFAEPEPVAVSERAREMDLFRALQVRRAQDVIGGGVDLAKQRSPAGG